MEEPSNNVPNKDTAYTSGKKAADVGLGIVGGIAYSVLCTYLLSAINGSFGWSVLAVTIYLMAVAFFFVVKRHYLAIGLLAIVAIPLLIFGGCMLLIGGLKL